MPSREDALAGALKSVECGEELSYAEGALLAAYCRELAEVLMAAQPYANQNPLLAEQVARVLAKAPKEERRDTV